MQNPSLIDVFGQFFAGIFFEKDPKIIFREVCGPGKFSKGNFSGVVFFNVIDDQENPAVYGRTLYRIGAVVKKIQKQDTDAIHNVTGKTFRVCLVLEYRM